MSVRCSSCDADNATGARFCARCGTPLPSSCQACGASLPTDARFCPACGRPADAAAGSSDERRLVTVLFADLADSTALGERLDPERLRAILQDYFSLVSSTVQAWGGTVEKYIGDAAVAVFGMPRVREDDAARAVSAAAEILDRVGDLAADVKRHHDVVLAVRIGVNTGEVVAPTEARPGQPMVTGDAINVAARLQASADLGSALIGERTYLATRSLFRFGEPVELTLKGKSGPVGAHPLLGRISGAVEAGPTRNLQARVVGRERELAVLEGLLDDSIETRAPRLAIVFGPAGIGKSRLVKEAIVLGTSERPDLKVLRGRCPAAGQRIAYWPFAEMVRAACGIALDDEAGETAERLRQRVGAILTAADVPTADRDPIVFALATTAGIALDGNPLDLVRPVDVDSDLARRWPQFLSALAARQPLVVAIEDLHWASDPVVEMVERLLARAAGAILIVATARPEFAEGRPSFAVGRSEAVSIALRPLDRGGSASLLEGLLPGHDLPAPMLEHILGTAEGNPLFVEEIVSRLIETGSLTRDDGRWRIAADAAEVAIPDTIHGLLASRIDALPEDERRVLREASVIGRIFWDAPVAMAVGATELGGSMAGLESRGLIGMRPTSSLAGQLEYAFKHALIRDVAYAGLSIARRARAHAAAAGWLASLSPDRPEELAELVAYHFRAALGEGFDLAWADDQAGAADLRRRARSAFLVAGTTSRKRYAIDTAIEFHELALGLSETAEEKAIASEVLGDDGEAGYDGDRAVPAWQEAIRLRRSGGDARADIARLSMKTARMGAIMWGGFTVPMEPEAIDRHVDEGLEAAADEPTRAWLLMLRAAAGARWIGFHRQDPVPLEDRVAAGEEARVIGERIGDAALQTNALRSVGALLISYGEVARGLDLTRPSLALVSGIVDTRQRHLMTIENASTLIWVGGEAEAMIPTLEAALRLGRELRVHDHCHSTSTLINALFLAGRWDEIPPYLDEHLRTFRIDEAGTSCPFALGVFPVGATLLAHRGERERARALVAETPRSEGPVGMVEGSQAMAALALGDPAEAVRLAREVMATGLRNFAEEPPVERLVILDGLVALEDWESLRAYLPEARSQAPGLALAGPAADRADGLMSAATGDHHRARELLGRALAAFDGLSPFEAARTREALATVDPDRRGALLAEAIAAYDRLGARPHAERARRTLENVGLPR
ncbi:MAG: AAA family ATPase [Candidatus Limnocylindrales bacterium]